MPAVIGLDRTLLRTLAHGVKAWRSFNNRSYSAIVYKLDRCGCWLHKPARTYSAMNAVNEGKRAAAYYAVDECIQVYVVRFQEVLKKVSMLRAICQSAQIAK